MTYYMMMSRVQEVDRAAGAGRCPTERTFAFIGERTRSITTALTRLHHTQLFGFGYVCRTGSHTNATVCRIVMFRFLFGTWLGPYRS
ncbi:unnamed protein product [Leptosia nina]|uniref:Uncharacterized protein n=1 Tax=Leptosia nina TaxID=320188 RepID=A0AAV1JU32_9NEOP